MTTTTTTSSKDPAQISRRNADALLALVCSALNDLMGGAATACLIRRAVKRSAGRCPEIAEITVSKDPFTYRYSAPASWSRDNADALLALAELMHELRPLLVELTGQVVVMRLHEIPELAQCGYFAAEVDP